MAVRTNHPVAPPPAPPERERTAHLLLRAWCVFVLALALSGVGWVNAIGALWTAVVVVSAAVVSVVLWLVHRPWIDWRRLPWFALAYVAWAAASLGWSAWPATTAITWAMLAITTFQALFLASALTWRELVRAIAAALKWVLAASLLFELFVSIVIGGPVLPGFVRPDGPVDDPIVYWSRDNLFDGGRIQGVFGSSNLLAQVALLAIVVFGILIAARAPRRVVLWLWLALAVFLFVRAGSATTVVAGAVALVVLGTVLLMRTVRRPGGRTKYYVLYAATAVVGVVVVWFGRDTFFSALGRSADLTGRESIWAAVLERAGQHPVVGWGFASPWMPWDPAFDGWIVDHGQTVMQAHNMWIDLFLQLGWIGVVLVAGIYVAFIWRAWFFAIDRPRWDLRADRPYSPLTLLPTLTAAMLLVEGMAESGPLLLWGWMLVVMFSFKLTQAPLVGVGAAEQSAALERGERPKQST